MNGKHLFVCLQNFWSTYDYNFGCFLMHRHQNNQNSFAKNSNLENDYVASGEIVIHNEAYGSSKAKEEKDHVSLSSVTLKNDHESDSD